MGHGDPNTTNNINPSTNIDAHGDAHAVIEFARKRTEPTIREFTDPEGIAPAEHVVIGHDANGATTTARVLFERDAHRKRPLRRKGSIGVTTLESFIALTNRQSGEDSVIFADDGEEPRLTAVLNFHGTGELGAPAFCDDRIVYRFPLSDEWKRWMSTKGQKYEQAQFAELIENWLFDIGEPGSAGAITERFAEAAGVKLSGPQAMRGLSKGLSIRVEHAVSRVVNLQSGEGRMEFSEAHKGEDGGPLTVPAAFHILIPVFRGGPKYSIPVRLRYRTGGGKVVWFFEVHEPHLFRLDAVNEALEIVRRDEDATKDAAGLEQKAGCGLPVYMGAPPGV